MATHSSTLAWRIQGQTSLVGSHLWGCTESDTTKVTQQQQQQQQQDLQKITDPFSHHLLLSVLGSWKAESSKTRKEA